MNCLASRGGAITAESDSTRAARSERGWGPGSAIAADGGPEALAVSVIAIAWQDLIAGRITNNKQSPHLPSQAQRQEAIDFLTSATGPWQQSRAMWCGLAGICPDRLRHQALRQVAP